MISTATELGHSFIRLPTNPLYPCAHSCSMQVREDLIPDYLPDLIKVTGQYLKTGDLDVFQWPEPARHVPEKAYPAKLRAFRQQEEVSGEEIELAHKLISDNGPFISLSRPEQPNNYLERLKETERNLIVHEVPEHQARGFHIKALSYWELVHKNRITTTVCTKGNGMTGYWIERRKKEMLEAIEQRDRQYPLNPDSFHARDHSGQSTGQKKEDETVWVGGASASVTEREVNGFQIYYGCGIFSPICLPPKIFEKLPLATGQLIDTNEFTSNFVKNEKLVYLAKAWGNETRIWRNHVYDRFMTAAHILSSKEEGKWIFERVLDNLSKTVQSRKRNLRVEEEFTHKLLSKIPKERWSELIGQAGISLQNAPIKEMSLPIIPQILAINMIENTARAGANRLWGKPVAWHLENIGRWGEVSGGERIYGKNAKGTPSSMEKNFFFACLFDGYMATAIEWSATNNVKYISFEEHFRQVRQRTLQLNENHWLNNITNIHDLIKFCELEKPEYEVKFRSEDAYPLVAVPGATAEECISTENSREWKNWKLVERNMKQFLNGIFTLYHS